MIAAEVDPAGRCRPASGGLRCSCRRRLASACAAVRSRASCDRCRMDLPLLPRLAAASARRCRHGRQQRRAGRPPRRSIVTLKADAPLLREQAHVGAPAAGRRGRGWRSAAPTGWPRALALRAASGAAICERAQVVRASGIDAATLARRLAADPEVACGGAQRAAARCWCPTTRCSAAGPASGRRPGRSASGTCARPSRRGALGGQCRGRLGPHHRQRRRGGGGARHRRALRPPGPGRPAAARLRHRRRRGRSPTTATAATPTPATPATGSPRPRTPIAADFCELRRRSSSWHGTQIAGLIGAATDNGHRHGRHAPRREDPAGARARQVRRLRLRHPGRHALGGRAARARACRSTRTRRGCST